MTMLPAWVTVRVAEEVVPVTVVAEKVPVPELDVSTVKAAGLLEPPLVTLTVIVSPGENVKVVPVGAVKVRVCGVVKAKPVTVAVPSPPLVVSVTVRFAV